MLSKKEIRIILLHEFKPGHNAAETTRNVNKGGYCFRTYHTSNMEQATDVLCELLNRSTVKDERNRCASRCQIELGDISRHNVMQLKRLNLAVFPICYNEKFYKEVTQSSVLAKLAYFNDVIVGGVCCRLETTEAQKRIYIMTLGTLAPYRHYGIGTMLLNHVFSICKNDPQITSVYLHVQTNNTSALEFYKRFGFVVTGRMEKYYKKIEPDDAFILEKQFNSASDS